jgi:hypothetical protein
MFLFFIIDANMQSISAASEIISNGATLFWQTQTIRSAIYGSLGTICLGLFFICLISGNLEKEEGHKK